jgi:hypothetical protein
VLHIKQLVSPKFGIKENLLVVRDTSGKKMMPLIEGLVTQRTLPKCGKKIMPLVGGLCLTADFDQIWSKYVTPARGLCLTVDFGQMWSEMCPLLEDFVSLQTSTKCGVKCAPCWRTLSRCGLQPNGV